MWFIGVEVEQETSAPPPIKNPGSAPVVHFNRISIYDKREDFAFRIFNFPHIDSSIPANPAYGVYIIISTGEIC